MPFPYDFPFNFDVEKVLRLLVKSVHFMGIKASKQDPLRIIKSTVKPMKIESNVDSPFTIRASTQEDLHITTGIEGGG
jgi:hypothetical protein